MSTRGDRKTITGIVIAILLLLVAACLCSCGPSKAELETRATAEDSSKQVVKIEEISRKSYDWHSYHVLVIGEDTVLALYSNAGDHAVALIELSK